MLAKTIFWNNRIMLASTKSPTLIVWDIKKKQATNILWKYSTATELLSYPVHGTWLYILCVIINDFHNLWHEQFNNSLLLILSEIWSKITKWKSFNMLPRTLMFTWLETHKSVGFKENIRDKRWTSPTAEEPASLTVWQSVLGNSRQCEERYVNKKFIYLMKNYQTWDKISTNRFLLDQKNRIPQLILLKWGFALW